MVDDFCPRFSGVFQLRFRGLETQTRARGARVSFVVRGGSLADDLRRLHERHRGNRCEQRESKGEVQHLFHLSVLSRKFASSD